MSNLEWLAAALVLTNVALVARRSLLNYPFGIAAVSLYAFIFHGERLYSEVLLQGFFLALNLYGWLNWRAAMADDGLPVGWMDARARLGWLVAVLLTWALWSSGMARLTSAAAPYADGAVAVLSVAAQWLQARRRVECWWLWMAVNLIAIPLFAARGLTVTAGVYIVLLVMAGFGLIGWQRAARRDTAA